MLRLEGPLQSWGLRSRWDQRDTGPEPSKSGVIGLLGCALGLARGNPELEKLDAELSFAIRLDRPGSVMVDFQTITGLLLQADGEFKGTPDNPATITSPRAYIQDAAFLAILSGPSKTLRRCRDALISPYWPIYLGRKACPPSRPVLDALTDKFGDMEQALCEWPWSPFAVNLAGKSPPKTLEAFVEDPRGGSRRPDAIRVNPARMYGERRARRVVVDNPYLEKG
jgi:CRISPR system Cascade subunit CasD